MANVEKKRRSSSCISCKYPIPFDSAQQDVGGLFFEFSRPWGGQTGQIQRVYPLIIRASINN